MSKSIYDEALKVVAYLQEQNSHLKDNCGTIYISSQDITTLENLLIHSHKQKKLLKLYREKDKYTETVYPLPIFDLNRYRNIVKLIRELENDIK